MTRPSFSVERILADRDRLREQVLYDCYGAQLEGPAYAQVAARLAGALKVNEAAVYESMKNTLGKLLTADLAFELCWRLAGNLPRLRRGEAVPLWSGQQQPEWAPLQILSCVPSQRHARGGGRIGFAYQGLLLAGSAAGRGVNFFWSREMISVAALRLGHTRMRGKHPLQASEELVQYRLCVYLDPELSRSSPQFQQLHVPSAMKEYNQKLIRARWREGWVCPQQYTHGCHVCPVGYDQCPVACHPYTHVAAICTGCRANNWHDPDPSYDTQHCLACRYRQAFKRQGGRE